MRGATGDIDDCLCVDVISIHAPHAGGDAYQLQIHAIFTAFQSTPPMRGATGQRFYHRQRKAISIHAPHAGGDCHRRGEAGRI